jgi:hypothetical protein
VTTAATKRLQLTCDDQLVLDVLFDTSKPLWVVQTCHVTQGEAATVPDFTGKTQADFAQWLQRFRKIKTEAPAMITHQEADGTWVTTPIFVGVASDPRFTPVQFTSCQHQWNDLGAASPATEGGSVQVQLQMCLKCRGSRGRYVGTPEAVRAYLLANCQPVPPDQEVPPCGLTPPSK